MRRPPGGEGVNGLAQALRRQLVPNPFLGSSSQWGRVKGIHGSFTSTLYAAASLGTQSVELNAAPSINDYLIIGASLPACRVTAVSGSAAPYTATLATPLATAEASGATVTTLSTVDVYLDQSDGNLSGGVPDPAYLTYGLAYICYYTPVLEDYVIIWRSEMSTGAGSDRIVMGRRAP